MLSDIFSVRYAGHQILDEIAQANYRQFCGQAWLIIRNDMIPLLPNNIQRPLWDYVTGAMQREIGTQMIYRLHFAPYFSGEIAPYEQLEGLITEEWTDRKPFPEEKDSRYRIDAVELLLREVGQTWRIYAGENKGAHPRRIALIANGEKAMSASLNEVNVRAQRAGLNIHFHNGIFQLGTDRGSESQITKPFWDLVADPAWKSVDDDMKEACDLRDRGAGDPIFHAGRALESALKIISDQTGRTTGNEKGMANYIDNLVREQNGGRFIEVWEKDMLGVIRDELRNKHSHGPGSKLAPVRTPEQIDWAIDVCMAWIKSLKRRLR